MIPTTAYLPPKLGSKEIMSEDYQNSTYSLLSIASISGCCQVRTLSLSLLIESRMFLDDYCSNFLLQ